MASGYQDFIPAGEDNTAYANGFQDFAAKSELTVSHEDSMTPEEEKRKAMLERLAKAREVAKANREAAKQE